MTLQLENFTIGQDTVVCCTDETQVALFDFDGEGAAPRGWFFFGVNSSGSQTWGLANGAEEVQDTFEVAPATDMQSLTSGAGVASNAIAAENDFNLYSLEVVEANSLVSVAAVTTGSATFQPWIWVLGANGMDIEAINPYEGEVSDANFANFVAEEAGTYYVRVMDKESAGATDFTYDLDVLVSAPSDAAPTDVPEVEDNDAAADWQDLGVLDVGANLAITGTSTTAGYNQDTYDWTGDLDVFTFSLAASGTVAMELVWPNEETNDFDAMLYDPTLGTPDVGTIDSEYDVGLGMASVDYPEQSTIQLLGGKEYVLMVANWEGDAGAAWTLNLQVLGGAPTFD
ncbi:MAG: hypothetical protein CL928_11045 [Deltaproteobacteria bacterium]|nr:hypothetical protein [Deltaproteobacteria bacterium]